MIFNSKNPPPGFYIYLYLREKDSENGIKGTPYYIGKGKNKRAWDKHIIPIPKDTKNIIILDYNLTEENALMLEKELIEIFGRINEGSGCLRNLTDGGTGISGYKHNQESKVKIGRASKGRLGPWHGKKMPEDMKIKMSESQKNANRPADIGEKISTAKKGKPSGHKGKFRSEDTKLKISQALVGKTKGKPWSDARRAAQLKKEKNYSI